MKLASTIARYLLGLVYLIFGSNGFLHFIPTPPPPGPGGMFMGGLFLSHELMVIMALQALGGILLLVNRFVPLALVVLGAITANIVLFHAFMAPSGLPVALFVSVLLALTFWNVRDAFRPVFQARYHTASVPETGGIHA
jgi:putative oxidoreductase